MNVKELATLNKTQLAEEKARIESTAYFKMFHTRIQGMITVASSVSSTETDTVLIFRAQGEEQAYKRALDIWEDLIEMIPLKE